MSIRYNGPFRWDLRVAHDFYTMWMEMKVSLLDVLISKSSSKFYDMPTILKWFLQTLLCLGSPAREDRLELRAVTVQDGHPLEHAHILALLVSRVPQVEKSRL